MLRFILLLLVAVTLGELLAAPAAAGTLPSVTLAVDDSAADEAGPDPAVFTVARSADAGTGSSLRVYLQLGGTAVHGADFSSSPTLSNSAPGEYWITIPTGQLSQAVTLTPLRDNRLEGEETISIDVLPGQLAGHEYAIGEPSNGAATIADDVTELTLSVTDGAGDEAGPDAMQYTFTRSEQGNTAASLRVYMQVGGTALISTDYSATPSLSSVGSGVHWITLPAGQLSLTVTLTPSPDNRLEGDETIDLDLLAPQLANHDYVVGEPSGGVATIADDIAEVTLTIDDGAAAELEENPGSLTIARSNHGNTAANLRVYLQVGGTAQFNTDYSVSPTLSTASAGVYFTTIPANQLSLTLTLTPDFDFSPEADESVTFGLIAGQLAGHDYLVGAPAAGQITILNHLEGIFADGFEGLLP